MPARYTIKEVAPNIYTALTTVTWSRTYGRCNRQDHSRTNVYHTQKDFKAWAQRNGVEIALEDLKLLSES